MTTYQAIYRCRLCGEEFIEGITVEGSAMAVDAALTVNETFYNGSTHTSGRRYMQHNCADGSFGFADFQGFRMVE